VYKTAEKDQYKNCKFFQALLTTGSLL